MDVTSFSSNSTISSDSSDWSEPGAQVCEHTLTLQQEPASDSSSTCSKCDLKNNLWKCLTCGTLSCGRRQFDGSGGNGHALEHYESCGHALAVKLGTISVKSDGIEADVYCYKCDDLVIDPELNSHLSLLGIDAASERKTEKSTGELNLEVNLTHTYSMTDASGNELEVLAGPWMRGFKNLGNSCYLASVIQSLRNLDKDAFLAKGHDYLTCQMTKATECLPCQLKKIYLGLEEDSELSQLSPWMFKMIAAGNNNEFLSGRQQDASEFLVHLLQNRFKRFPELSGLSKLFEIQMEEIVVCGGCGERRISSHSESCLILSTPEKQVCDLDELLQMRFSPETVDWRCDRCENCCKGTHKQTKIVALPKYLVLVANRLKLKNWVPEKTECHISGMDEHLSLEQFCDKRSAGSNSAKNTSDNSGGSAVLPDPLLLGELLMMGIEEEPARAALIACNNTSLDSAMTIIFEGGVPEGNNDNNAAIETLVSAGFTEAQAKKALESTGGDIERAFDWLFSHPEESVEESSHEQESLAFTSKYELSSFITHKGTSVFCGHYVAHLKDHQDRWILYNDEKVAVARIDDSFPVKDAYIYIYKLK